MATEVLGADQGFHIGRSTRAETVLVLVFTIIPLTFIGSQLLGFLISGTGGCQFFKDEPCFVVGHDPQTGKELWRTHTIAMPGDPNEASWAGVPLNLRAGVDTWIPGSYDPKLDTFYIGTAQAKPWVAASRRMKPTDAALYSNSTLALDPRTGKMKWWFQHMAGESLDMDVVYERALIDVDGRPTQAGQFRSNYFFIASQKLDTSALRLSHRKPDRDLAFSEVIVLQDMRRSSDTEKQADKPKQP